MISSIKKQIPILLALLSLNVFAADSESENIPPLPPMEMEALPKDADETKADTVVINDKPAKNFSSFLNALELAGYFRMRFNYFHNSHLATYIPETQIGTSSMLPNLSLSNIDGNIRNADDKAINPSQSNFSANMRFRLDPTINVSEIISIKSSLDIFDNLVLGSTPYYNNFYHFGALSMSQSAPKENAIKLKRLWAEASFPIAELKFGRMPLHFGLGILYNSGDNMDDDYGDQVDGLSLSTKIFDLYTTLGYSLAYVGPVGRGFGLNTAEDPSKFSPLDGQKYPLDTSDKAHVFSLSLLKKDSDYIIQKRTANNLPIFQYGLFLSYRSQELDTQYDPKKDDNPGDPPGYYNNLRNKLVKRNAHIGLSSIWSSFDLSTFHLEGEFAAIFGRYRIGSGNADLLAKDEAGNYLSARNVWLLNAGFALESKYGFFDDRLQIGLDGGWASGDDNYSVNMNASKSAPKSKFVTSFRFNQAYTVDRLMYRQILGTVTGSFYFKPHVAYFFSPNLGLRGDVITSLADYKMSTPGKSHWLGVEADATAFFRTDSGIYLSASYALLFPLAGLNHQEGSITNQLYKNFGTASIAQSLQLFLGFSF